MSQTQEQAQAHNIAVMKAYAAGDDAGGQALMKSGGTVYSGSTLSTGGSGGGGSSPKSSVKSSSGGSSGGQVIGGYRYNDSTGTWDVVDKSAAKKYDAMISQLKIQNAGKIASGQYDIAQHNAAVDTYANSSDLQMQKSRGILGSMLPSSVFKSASELNLINNSVKTADKTGIGVVRSSFFPIGSGHLQVSSPSTPSTDAGVIAGSPNLKNGQNYNFKDIKGTVNIVDGVTFIQTPNDYKEKSDSAEYYWDNGWKPTSAISGVSQKIVSDYNNAKSNLKTFQDTAPAVKSSVSKTYTADETQSAMNSLIDSGYATPTGTKDSSGNLLYNIDSNGAIKAGISPNVIAAAVGGSSVDSAHWNIILSPYTRSDGTIDASKLMSDYTKLGASSVAEAALMTLKDSSGNYAYKPTIAREVWEGLGSDAQAHYTPTAHASMISEGGIAGYIGRSNAWVASKVGNNKLAAMAVSVFSPENTVANYWQKSGSMAYFTALPNLPVGMGNMAAVGLNWNQTPIWQRGLAIGGVVAPIAAGPVIKGVGAFAGSEFMASATGKVEGIFGFSKAAAKAADEGGVVAISPTTAGSAIKGFFGMAKDVGDYDLVGGANKVTGKLSKGVVGVTSKVEDILGSSGELSSGVKGSISKIFSVGKTITSPISKGYNLAKISGLSVESRIASVPGIGSLGTKAGWWSDPAALNARVATLSGTAKIGDSGVFEISGVSKVSPIKLTEPFVTAQTEESIARDINWAKAPVQLAPQDVDPITGEVVRPGVGKPYVWKTDEILESARPGFNKRLYMSNAEKFYDLDTGELLPKYAKYPEARIAANRGSIASEAKDAGATTPGLTPAGSKAGDLGRWKSSVESWNNPSLSLPKIESSVEGLEDTTAIAKSQQLTQSAQTAQKAFNEMVGNLKVERSGVKVADIMNMGKEAGAVSRETSDVWNNMLVKAEMEANLPEPFLELKALVKDSTSSSSEISSKIEELKEFVGSKDLSKNLDELDRLVNNPGAGSDSISAKLGEIEKTLQQTNVPQLSLEDIEALSGIKGFAKDMRAIDEAFAAKIELQKYADSLFITGGGEGAVWKEGLPSLADLEANPLRGDAGVQLRMTYPEQTSGITARATESTESIFGKIPKTEESIGGVGSNEIPTQTIRGFDPDETLDGVKFKGRSISPKGISRLKTSEMSDAAIEQLSGIYSELPTKTVSKLRTLGLSNSQISKLTPEEISDALALPLSREFIPEGDIIFAKNQGINVITPAEHTALQEGLSDVNAELATNLDKLNDIYKMPFAPEVPRQVYGITARQSVTFGKGGYQIGEGGGGYWSGDATPGPYDYLKGSGEVGPGVKAGPSAGSTVSGLRISYSPSTSPNAVLEQVFGKSATSPNDVISGKGAVGIIGVATPKIVSSSSISALGVIAGESPVLTSILLGQKTKLGVMTETVPDTAANINLKSGVMTETVPDTGLYQQTNTITNTIPVISTETISTQTTPTPLPLPIVLPPGGAAGLADKKDDSKKTEKILDRMFGKTKGLIFVMPTVTYDTKSLGAIVAGGEMAEVEKKQIIGKTKGYKVIAPAPAIRNKSRLVAAR